jgi:hypothetical protein
MQMALRNKMSLDMKYLAWYGHLVAYEAIRYLRLL